MQPLVSVCIPAYNNAAYIKDTIDSILNQTYKNIELIIVDDCSTDNTLAVLHAIDDNRVKVYENEQNLGMSGNWNKCLSLCEGEYFMLIGADDMLAPEAIEKQCAVLEDYPDIVMAETDTKLVDLDGVGKGFYRRYHETGRVCGKKVLRKGFFVKDYFGAPQSNLVRRNIANRVGGFDPYFTYILDYDFFASVANMGDLYIIHEPLNYFRVRKDSNTGEIMGRNKDKTRVYINEHKHLVEKNQEALNLKKWEIELSVLIRKVRCVAASVYMKIFVHK